MLQQVLVSDRYAFLTWYDRSLTLQELNEKDFFPRWSGFIAMILDMLRLWDFPQYHISMLSSYLEHVPTDGHSASTRRCFNGVTNVFDAQATLLQRQNDATCLLGTERERRLIHDRMCLDLIEEKQFGYIFTFIIPQTNKILRKI